jgi:glycosyltransferase involved in cell wall biosynthesis
MRNSAKIPISVAIITQNEESNILACLESITWADEIIVVDAFSEDKTTEIAAKFTDKIYKKEWAGFSKQKQFALDQCTNEWVLSLDADERVRPELADEITKTLRTNPIADGYLIARRSYFLNNWIKQCGWYPGYQVRLFKKSKTKLSESRVHEGYLVDGNIEKLLGDIDHYSHPSLHNSLEKLNRYSTLEAFDRLDRKTVRWFHFITHPLSAFLIKYIRQKGFMDGMHGFLLAWISSFLKMVMYMKIWRLQRLNKVDIERLKQEAL